MKIGLLSDIHANVYALRVVLNSAKDKKVQKILCCGDYVGYYYHPKKVIKLLDKWDWDGVSGNHEGMLEDWLNKKNKNRIMEKYGSGISIAAEKLNHELAVRLYEMPITKKVNIDDLTILLCHGSPWNRDKYIYPDARNSIINKLFEYDSDFDILVYGHTHYPVLWEKGNKKIINPGSVGQPRDRKPGASWAILDTDTNDVTF